MAQPTNTFDSYDINGIREQLSDTITMISPEDTPFFSACRKIKGTNTFVEWQTDSLRAAQLNENIEGDDTVASARTATVRLGNYTAVPKDAATISGTDKALNKAGRGREMVREIMKIGKELKLDLELMLFTNQARAAGSSTAPRKMAGVPAWLATNTSGGTGAVDPTGDGTDARTAGSNRNFVATLLNTGLQDAWTAGGKPDTAYAGPSQVTTLAGFTGSNNQRNTVDKRQISYAVDVYMTSFGTVEIVPSRYTANDVYLMQSDMWEIAVARPFTAEPLGKTGDNDKEQVVGEYTLCAKNEASSAAVYDLN